MYPKLYIDAFRSFPRVPEVFVAMPFRKDFDHRWKNIFSPAIKKVGLMPFRVKESIRSDSIPNEILDHIGKAKLILVDISDEYHSQHPNPNVMYELGIGHSIRLPEEVIIVRDLRSGNAPFDIQHIRWNSFPDNNIKTSFNKIISLLKNAEKEVEILKDKIIDKVLNALDSEMAEFLVTVRAYDRTGFDLQPFDPDRKGHYGLPSKDCSEHYLREIARKLISLGILKMGDLIPFWQRFYGTSSEYRFTELGHVVLQRFPDMNLTPTQDEIKKWVKKQKRALLRRKNTEQA